MAQHFTKIKNENEILYRASEVDPYVQSLEAEVEALRSGRAFKLEPCITLEDVVRREG